MRAFKAQHLPLDRARDVKGCFNGRGKVPYDEDLAMRVIILKATVVAVSKSLSAVLISLCLQNRRSIAESRQEVRQHHQDHRHFRLLVIPYQISDDAILASEDESADTEHDRETLKDVLLLLVRVELWSDTSQRDHDAELRRLADALKNRVLAETNVE